MSAATSPVAVVTLSDVRRAAKACAAAADASNDQRTADDAKKASMLTLFEPLLGIKSSQELAAISPEQMKRKIMARVRSGAVELEGVEMQALLDAIRKTQARRSVQWKEAFIAALGEARAAAVQAEAEETFSYKVVEPECI